MPTCLGCGTKITQDEKWAKFECPNCGQVTIWRCEKCRIFGREYKCPKCGFVGP
ncbi:MAG: zinc finger domain-containing protein [Candidatus Bathyarchaeia archaeon]